MSTSTAVHGPLAEPLRTHARADTWFRLRSPQGLPEQMRDLARRELELAAEGLWAAPGPALDAGVLYARSAVEKVRLMVRLVRGGMERRVRRDLNDRLRSVRRDLERLRDVGALEEVVDRLRQASREAPLREGLGLLGGRLTEQRFRDGAGRLEAEDVGTLRERIEELGDEVEGLPVEGDGFELLAPGVERLHRRAGRELRRLRKGKDSSRRHRRLMRRMRDLGYAVRLCEPAWPAALCAVGHEIDRVAGRLREADHLDVLRARLADDASLARGLPQELNGRFQGVRDHFRAEALNGARRLLADDAVTFRTRLDAWWSVWEDESRVPSDG